jgi:hypothetical protein
MTDIFRQDALTEAKGGWVLSSLRDSIKALQKTDAELADKVQHIDRTISLAIAGII